ncbi:MAG: phosphoglycerate kinase [Bacilli bacterium]
MLIVNQLENVSGKVIIVRVDFNVPLKSGVIKDDNRISAALPTIKELISKGAKVVLMSHLGKIKHKEAPEIVAEAKAKNDLAPVAIRLSELLGQKVNFVNATRGAVLTDAVKALLPGEVLLMQNTRYEKGEEKNDAELSAIWANLADGFVMDAFGSAHRAHASTFGVPELLKKEGKPVAVGYLVEKEIEALSRCVEVQDSDRPYIAILGGFKVSDKIKVIETLLTKCDKILIGGAMTYTFLAAKGISTGTSPVEIEQAEYARKCLASGKIVLPVDSICADGFESHTEVRIVEGNIPEGFQGLDVGPKTLELYRAEIAKAKMIFWNGPVGVFEQEEFATGTKEVCKAIVANTKAFTVIGGGDSASAAKQFGYKDGFSHVSTGGGASLEMIENDGHLPGIDIIK